MATLLFLSHFLHPNLSSLWIWFWEKLNDALNNASIKETHKDCNLDEVCLSLVLFDNLPLYNKGRAVLWHYFCLLSLCSWLSSAQSDMASFLSGRNL